MVIRGQLDPIDPVVDWMRERGVRRVRLPDGLEVELDPFVDAHRREAAMLARASSAMDGKPAAAAVQDERPVPIAKALEDEDGAGVCSCGHSWLEHSDAGCFRGCSLTVCNSTDAAEAAS